MYTHPATEKVIWWHNTSLSVRVMTKGSRYAQQIIITQAGTMKPGLS